MSSAARRAAGALAIRRAAAPLLLHATADPESWARAAAMDEDAWRLFLRVERCALPLQRALEQAAIAQTSRAPFRIPLGQVAQREAARVLVGRRLLRAVSEFVSTRRYPVIVLKGGIEAVGPEPLDLADVDLLMREDHAWELEETLGAQGWRVTGESTDHVGHVLVAHDLRVEVHRSLGLDPAPDMSQLLAASEALDGWPELRRLGARDHLRHVLQHTALVHPERRLRLRDLVVVARAARRCTAGEVSSACEGLAASYAAAVSRVTLEAALQPASDGAAREIDRRALETYVLAQRLPVRFLPVEVSVFLHMWAMSMLYTRWERRQIWSSTATASLRPSSRAYIRAVEQRLPALGRAWRVSARAAYRGATWLVARPLAAHARRTVRHALDAPAAKL